MQITCPKEFLPKNPLKKLLSKFLPKISTKNSSQNIYQKISCKKFNPKNFQKYSKNIPKIFHNKFQNKFQKKIAKKSLLDLYKISLLTTVKKFISQKFLNFCPNQPERNGMYQKLKSSKEPPVLIYIQYFLFQFLLEKVQTFPLHCSF